MRLAILVLAALHASLYASTAALQAQGDSLFHIGEYQASLAAYSQARAADTADADLLFKHFLACEFRGGECGSESRTHLRYSERMASPYTGIIRDYLQERWTVSA